MKNLEKLEAMAEKRRASIKAKQEALKKETDALKDIEAEIDALKGEAFRKEINKLNLTSEEFEKFQQYVLSSKSNLLEAISLMSQEKKKQEEGVRPTYE